MDDKQLHEYSHEYSRYPDTDDRAAYDVFKSGLHPSYFRYLVHSNDWGIYDELMKQVTIYAKVEYFNSKTGPMVQ